MVSHRRLLAALTAYALVSTVLAATLGTTDVPSPPRTTGFDAPVTPVVGVRPLLTVLMEFSDETADVPADFIHGQIFGPRPSMNDYFLETTYGLFSFQDAGHWSWVMAWDDPATTDDESTRAYWVATGLPTYGDGYFQSWGLRSLDAAGYDFGPLDADGDGAIAFGTEVAYLVIDAKPAGERGGASRCMPALTLDGKTTGPGGTLGCPHGVSAGVAEDSPWITLYAHELGHEALDFFDYYAIAPQNIGYFSLMGYSGEGAWETPVGPHHLDPFYKMKRGWYEPTVVAADGWFDVPDAETNPAAFILHDPAHGTEEYFMVENRWRGTSYDNTDDLIGPLVPPLPPANAAIDIPDEGLLIWHVDETRDWDGTRTGGHPKVALERRNLTDDQAAFNGDDPANYDFYDGSSPQNAAWNTGADSGAGVWCVSPAAATMRAFLDVPGPGVLVCSPPLTASAVPGSTATVTVPIRNTGDALDTFAISVLGPGGITATLPPPETVSARTEVDVTVGLTPIRACTTATGTYDLTILVTSTVNPGVSESVPVTLTVLPFGDPRASVAVIDGDVEPGATGTFDLALRNEGNAPDTMSLAFTGLDFGSAYEADPTAIPASWVTFSPADPSAPACDVAGSVLSIAVPADWAGMEDAVYDFVVTVTSGIDGASGTAGGQLLVRATPLSRMFYVRAECEDLIDAVSALPPSDVRDGLLDKATAACAKLEQAIDRYALGDDPPASNLLRTVQNVLAAFRHQADAQRGKALTDAEHANLVGRTQRIASDIDAILALI